MTVKELIEALKECNPNAIVKICTEEVVKTHSSYPTPTSVDSYGYQGSVYIEGFRGIY